MKKYTRRLFFHLFFFWLTAVWAIFSPEPWELVAASILNTLLMVTCLVEAHFEEQKLERQNFSFK